MLTKNSKINKEVSNKVEFKVQLNNKTYDIYFKCSDSKLMMNSEALIACLLFPYMKNNRDLIINGNISKRFLTSVNRIMEIFKVWGNADLSLVNILNSNPIIRPKLRKNRVGVFFSGGVDSFFSMLKHYDEIDDLIFIYGFEMHIGETETFKRALESIQKVALSSGKHLIQIETNLRILLDPYVSWKFTHGAALGAIGHLLSTHFSTIYIPSSDAYDHLVPYGSHPLVDPLWSSEALEFIHDGCEANRVEKVQFISNFDVALKNLRVCWEHWNDDFNCCECEKCVRTMLDLICVGAIDKCTTFNKPLTKKNILAIQAQNMDILPYYMEILYALEDSKSHTEIYKIVKRIIYRPLFPIILKQDLIRRLHRYPLFLNALVKINRVINQTLSKLLGDKQLLY